MKHTPTPWHIATRRDGLGSLPSRDSVEIVHDYPQPDGGRQVVVGKHTGIDCLTERDAKHIVKCVNQHDKLKALLRSFVADIEAMQRPFRHYEYVDFNDEDANKHFFGGFDDYYDESEQLMCRGNGGVSVQWPNLGILLEDAKKALGEEA